MAQCPSCKFENMPQRTTCVRCGAILPGSNFPVEVEPPRAGKIEKVLRLAGVIYALNRFSAVVAFCFGGIGKQLLLLFQVQNRSANLTVFGMFWKGTLPGLAQWYYGRTPHDRHFFFGWLILLIAAFLTLGLTAFGFLLGAAVMCHLASIIDITILTCPARLDRLFLFAVMTIGAFFLFYVPTSVVWGHLGVLEVTAVVGPLQIDDALLYRGSWRTIKPRIGSLAYYRAPHVTYSTTGEGAPDNLYLLDGPTFDRVLAREGETVSWKEGILTIDGKPPLCQPFTTFPQPPDTTFVVPPDYCYIVPSVAFQGIPRPLGMPKKGEDWQAMGLVPYRSVYGVIWAARRSFFEFVDIKPRK